MNLTYRTIDYNSADDCELLARWYNDRSSRHLHILFTSAENAAETFTPEHFQRLGQSFSAESTRHDLMVLVDGVPAGEARIEMDPPKLLTKRPNTAWIYLMIAKPNLRRCGLGTRITDHLESLAVDTGAERIEAGIFEYNAPSLSFFTRRGYTEFQRRPNRIWWDGRMWNEVRLLKTL